MATQETIARPAPFVEKLGEDLATQVTAQTAVPIVSTGLKDLGTMAQPTVNKLLSLTKIFNSKTRFI